VKKTTWIRIAQIGVTAVPPVVVLCCYFPDFIKDTGTTISAAGLLVAVILACIFRDQTKKIFQTPSAFKICLCVFILSVISINLGHQMMVISATALVSGACGVPLSMWYNYETQGATTDDILEAMKDLVKEKKDEEKQPDDNH
jgi:uncharacterized protein with PQ loop repeat